MSEKISKQDEYIDKVSKFAAYIDHDENVVGIFATMEDCAVANKSLALKKLKSLYKYTIQMVIK